MQKYLFSALESGMQIVGSGTYRKTFKNGKPVTNVRGRDAAPERLLLLTRNGVAKQLSEPIILDHIAVRPYGSGSYSTEKAESFISDLVNQSTKEGDAVLDPFAGSGVFGKVAMDMRRIVYLVEKIPETIQEYIFPRLNAG